MRGATGAPRRARAPARPRHARSASSGTESSYQRPSFLALATSAAMRSSSCADSFGFDDSTSVATASYRAVEERVDEVRDCGSLRLAARDGGRVDVARAVLLVANVAPLLEEAEERAHRRIARRIGEIVHHLVCGRAPASVQDVHDLALAARQRIGLLHHVLRI